MELELEHIVQEDQLLEMPAPSVYSNTSTVTYHQNQLQLYRIYE